MPGPGPVHGLLALALGLRQDGSQGYSLRPDCPPPAPRPIFAAHAMLHAGGRRVTPCGFCGADNDPASRFCIDCGKPLSESASRAAPAFMTAATGAESLATAGTAAMPGLGRYGSPSGKI